MTAEEQSDVKEQIGGPLSEAQILLSGRFGDCLSYTSSEWKTFWGFLRAEQIGLSYISENIGPRDKVRELPRLVSPSKIKIQELCSDGINIRNEEEISIGSKRFIATYLADAYVGSDCGCNMLRAGGFPNIGEVIPLKLLEYAPIFYIVSAEGCGMGFGTYFRGTNKERPSEDRSEIARIPIEDRVQMCRTRITESARMPNSLTDRLHVIPVVGPYK